MPTESWETETVGIAAAQNLIAVRPSSEMAAPSLSWR
jgi:hypothetical protein